MLDLGLITEKLRQRVPRPLEKMAKCAVLIPLIENQGQWEVIYELRAMDMKTQPGEVSFPGGGLEPKETFMKAAIRETVEELKIKEDNRGLGGVGLYNFPCPYGDSLFFG